MEAKWLQGGQGFPIRAGNPGVERHLFALEGAGVAAAQKRSEAGGGVSLAAFPPLAGLRASWSRNKSLRGFL